MEGFAGGLGARAENSLPRSADSIFLESGILELRRSPRPTGETRPDLQELWSTKPDGRAGGNNFEGGKVKVDLSLDARIKRFIFRDVNNDLENGIWPNYSKHFWNDKKIDKLIEKLIFRSRLLLTGQID